MWVVQHCIVATGNKLELIASYFDNRYTYAEICIFAANIDN